MIILLLWIFGAFFIAAVFGTARTIGFGGAFFLSLLFSPIIGLIICLFSDTLEEDKRKKESLIVQKEILNNSKQNNSISIADEIEKLKKMHEQGIITLEEFEAGKKKLLI